MFEIQAKLPQSRDDVHLFTRDLYRLWNLVCYLCTNSIWSQTWFVGKLLTCATILISLT